MSIDVRSFSNSEMRPPAAAGLEGFDPDRRLDSRGPSSNRAESFDPDRRLERLYTPREDRIRTAGYTDGVWDGDVGDSNVRPNPENILGRAAIAKMREFGLGEIPYKDGVVDFSECSVETVEIGLMTDDIEINRNQALSALAAKWYLEGRRQDDGSVWTPNAIRDWAKTNGLAFHECSDMKTCQFVPKEIHSYFKHYGGRAECKARDGLANGGGFDA